MGSLVNKEVNEIVGELVSPTSSFLFKEVSLVHLSPRLLIDWDEGLSEYVVQLRLDAALR